MTQELDSNTPEVLLEDLQEDVQPDEMELNLLRAALLSPPVLPNNSAVIGDNTKKDIAKEPEKRQEKHLYILNIVLVVILVYILLNVGPIRTLLRYIRKGPLRICVIVLVLGLLSWLIASLVIKPLSR